MEAQNPSKQSSLALRPKIKAALRQRFTKRGDAPAQAPSQDQEPAQHTQQEDKPAATQFHLFPDLPTELRVMIWAEATRYKRYVVLDPPNNSAIACARLARRHRTYPKPGYAGERRPMWTTRTPPPALLSVSREAREVALRTWQLAFGWHDVFPAAVYINFDQDDVVIGAGARVNKIGKDFIPKWLRPYSTLVAILMVAVWISTHDVEKIQRVVACGNFMKGKDRLGPWVDFLTGLQSVTMVKIGDYRRHFLGDLYHDYKTSKRSRKGSPLLSLGGIDFVKTKGASICSTRSFAEIEIMDFVGDSPLADIRSRWTMGPEAPGWGPPVDVLPTRVHLGPQKRCVRRSRWRCYTTWETDIWYAI